MADSTGSEALARRLDRIGAWSRPDHDDLLSYLGAIGRSGLGVGIGLIVDGVLVIGAIGPQQPTQEAVRDAMTDAMEGSRISPEFRDVLEDSWKQLLTQDQSSRSKEDDLMDRYDPDVKIDEIDVDDVYNLYRMVDTDVLDLHDAQVHAAGGTDPIRISAMRVRFSSISAWWPLKAQGVHVEYRPASSA